MIDCPYDVVILLKQSAGLPKLRLKYFERIYGPDARSLCDRVTHVDCVFSELIKEVLSKDEQIHTLAQELYQQRSLLVMGRGFNYATCLEGALVRVWVTPMG